MVWIVLSRTAANSRSRNSARRSHLIYINAVPCVTSLVKKRYCAKLGGDSFTGSARPGPEGQHMRTILISAVVITTLVTGATIESAQAKGCIKGALLGGVAGHTAGHTVLGTIGGCVTGRAVAKRAARQRAQRMEAQRIEAQRQRSLANSGTVRPPGYNPGMTSQGQGYAPRITPGSGTTQTYAPGTFRQQ
jgi:outer membrane lipoprotein SlyB